MEGELGKDCFIKGGLDKYYSELEIQDQKIILEDLVNKNFDSNINQELKIYFKGDKNLDRVDYWFISKS